MTFLPLFSLIDAASTSGFGFVLVISVLIVIALFVKLLSKIINGASQKGKDEAAQSNVSEATPPAQPTAQEAEATETSPVAVAEELPYTPGYVTLDGVSEQDAAVIMAITSDKTGIPLERLCFKSIRRLNQECVLENIEEQDAAVIMAIVANKTGINLENLSFNSIKLVEE